MKIHPCLAQLRAHLESARYTPKVADRYLAVASYFVYFLDKNHVPIESAQPDHVHGYTFGSFANLSTDSRPSASYRSRLATLTHQRHSYVAPPCAGTLAAGSRSSESD
jgi:hypothetical protein